MARYTILVVDDEPANIETLAAALEDHYEVHFATTGEDALVLARKTPQPDAILLDVMLPDLDGYEICARLKADPETVHLPVIFVTALTDPGEETRGLESGAVDYITKPFSPAIVRARVRNHIEMKEARELLRQLAITDALTGLSNRRHFDETLALEIQRHSRRKLPLSLVLVDVDHFKRFNDRYGHPAGDACLRKIAGAVVSVLRRPADLAARIGGEEFACLLPETDSAGALAVADDILMAINGLAIPHSDSNVAAHVSASFGVATIQPANEQTGKALYEQADANLYRAKNEGRNRVIGN